MSAAELTGKLNVKVPGGKGFGEKADTYIKIYIVQDALVGKKKRCVYKGKADKNDDTPEFKIDVNKTLKGKYETLKIGVYSKKMGSDKELGAAEIKMTDIKTKKTIKGDYPIGKASIHVEVKFEEGSAGIMGEFESTSDSD
mmetsp:Transcript_8044/g.14292  ORF Transcript_8044/g.14292 Transcript_8044/m.14292 type:complete len:141 (+) Transcript_8044:188-610(+)